MGKWKVTQAVSCILQTMRETTPQTVMTVVFKSSSNYCWRIINYRCLVWISAKDRVFLLCVLLYLSNIYSLLFLSLPSLCPWILLAFKRFTHILKLCPVHVIDIIWVCFAIHNIYYIYLYRVRICWLLYRLLFINIISMLVELSYKDDV